MQKNILGKTDLSVSQLGYGAAPIGFLETQIDQVRKVLHYLLDSGLNLIDTAACYKGSEEALGQVVSDRRDEFVLVSKAGHASGLEGDDFTPALIHASIDRSLQRLQTDHLDVLLLHSCDLETLKQGDAIGAVLEAREAGKVRVVGYSGDNEAAAWAAAHPELDVIEMSINICDQHNIEAVLPVCIEHDKGVIAKRPLANAAWNPLDKQRGMYRSYAKTYHDRLAAMNVNPGQLGYSGHVELEWPEIALKFCLAIPGVHCGIVGTTDLQNAEANVDAMSKNPLRQQVVDRLREAFAQAEAASGETWQGQT